MKRTFLLCTILLSVIASVVNASTTLTGGVMERVRHEYWKNVFDMNTAAGDDRSFFRFKTSLWGQASVQNRYTLFMKLTNENRPYVDFQGGDSKFNIHEGVFDNLYIDIRGIGGQLIDLRVGRQDLLPAQYGEGFLIGDGTPLDGSRTYYFNAAKLTWKANEKNTVEAIGIADQKFDTFLPKINEVDPRQQLNATNESALVLYHRADPSAALHLEDYYILKDEEDLSKLSTVGCFARYTGSFATLRGQAAYQFGSFGANDRTGIGGYLFADKNFAAALKPTLTLGGVYLSGDDPATKANEAWDPLFSRYPWLSELYVLSYTRESGVGYWTNLSLYRVGASITPLKPLKISAWYNILYANQAVTGALFGAGKERGQMPQVRADWAIAKNVSAYFLAEYLMPGNFYAGTDTALFTRAELMVRY